MSDSFDFELFVSYCRVDNRPGQITEIVARIQKEYRDFTGGGELRVFFDQRELASSDEWQQRALNAISSSRLLFGKEKDRTFATLGELSEGEALTLVERYQPDGRFRDLAARAAALDIVHSLRGFTLALERAAVFIGQSASSLDCISFRDRLRSERLTSLEEVDVATFDDSSSYFKKCLTATLRLTLEQLHEAERVTLIFASLLPADHVTTRGLPLT